MQLRRYNADFVSRREDSYRSGRRSTQQLELMQKDEASKSGSNAELGNFQTIDDLWRKAEDLSAGLKRLSLSKHPLAIRRGVRRGVRGEVRDNEKSIQIKAAGRTYFLDIESTREGKSYLRITESRKGQDEKWERSSIIVFPEDGDEFASAVSQMTSKLN